MIALGILIGFSAAIGSALGILLADTVDIP